jgi:hypothetical protein
MPVIPMNCQPVLFEVIVVPGWVYFMVNCPEVAFANVNVSVYGPVSEYLSAVDRRNGFELLPVPVPASCGDAVIREGVVENPTAS